MLQPITLQKIIDPNVVDLAVGHPDPALLPLDIIRTAAAGALENASPELLQYSYEQGDAHFRESLARFLSREYGAPVTAESLFIDSGVSQGLDLFCTFFSKPGDTVLVEDPTYFLALKLFRDHGLRVVSVPTSDEGVDIESLERIAKQERPVFFYTVPVHQNPAGFTQPAEKRQQVVDCARRYGFTVLADEVYHLLTYDGTVPAPFASYLDSGHVVSLSSFSKISAPGLRLGWFQAPEGMRKRIFSSGLLDSGGGLNPVIAAIMHRAVADGSALSHLQQLRDNYNTRRKAMDKALSEEAADMMEWKPVRGGFFFWLRLKRGDAATLSKAAARHQVNFLPGSGFSPSGGLQEYIRLCFTHYPPERLREGVRRLAAAARETAR